MKIYEKYFNKIRFYYLRNQYKKLIAKNNKIDEIFTHLTKEEKFILYRLAKKTHGNFVEIGSYLGASACCIAQAIRENKNKGKLFCIDTWQNDAMSYEENEIDGTRRNTFNEFIDNTKYYSDNLKMLKGWSYDVIDELKKENEDIDFLFIDGNHNYDGVKKDWDLYSPLLKKNAIVVFHDSGWAEGVQKVINEEALKKLIYKGSLPNMWWGKWR